jgi:hypothetical protein
MYATCLAQFFLLDVDIKIIIVEEQKLRTSTFCNVLHFPVISVLLLLDPDFQVITLFSDTLIVCSSPKRLSMLVYK